MKIPEWAKSALVTDKIRFEVLRDMMRKKSKPRKIVHCLCGSGCKKCYGELHCGCRYCYRAETRPRPLSMGDLESLDLLLESSDVLLMPDDLHATCTAKQVWHSSRKLEAENSTPAVKMCRYINTNINVILKLIKSHFFVVYLVYL
jgi:hypothetical protein